MMIILRIAALLALGAVAWCTVAWMRTGDRAWLRRAMRILVASLGGALLFFAVLTWDRLTAEPEPPHESRPVPELPSRTVR